MDNSPIQLLDSYLSGECTEEERLQVETWLQQMEVSRHDWAAMDDTARAAWMAEVYGNIRHTITRQPALYRRLSRIAAAAVIVLSVGTATYLWLHHPAPGNTPVTANHSASKNDALPGHEGAILTLADNRQVLLDSLGDGVIANQGSTTVLIKDKQLAYTGKTSDTAMLYNSMTTPKGRQYRFVLPDGTRVWLNAASSITYPTAFSGKDRSVSISGEAYFEVAKDQSKPFQINVRDMKVEVLGTSVNIKAYPDETTIRTTLLEGGVKVRAMSASVVLKPGEQASLQTGATHLQVKGQVDLGEVMAWKNGYFQFNEADIRTVMQQLSRWYDLEVIYEGKVPNDHFGGKLPRDANASEVLKALEQTQVHFRIEGKKLIVMP